MSQKAKASSMELMAQEADTSNARGPNWTQEELKDLINIWLEERIIDRLENRRNKPVYVEIAEGMQAQGHSCDLTQVQYKTKSLRSAFYRAKDANSHSRAGHTIAPFYDKLSVILSKGVGDNLGAEENAQLWEKVTWSSKELEDVRDSNVVACEAARAAQSHLETLEWREGKIMIACVATSLQKRVQLAQVVEPHFEKVRQCLYGMKPEIELWENHKERTDEGEEIDDYPGAKPSPYVPAWREELGQAFPVMVTRLGHKWGIPEQSCTPLAVRRFEIYRSSITPSWESQ
ncbi:hypothetical protein Y1Q_0006392 [Alligator mississippiensis]|uniref:Myb/SANT-like DNA-binding domain-containing protein n=1 Tax=Alligator mississippiensis TaxID=8496 RepID=A0A151NYX4_ALLMI|nr:hypothetical protein Y1Q_0006392 [Alligator mississippiensis]